MIPKYGTYFGELIREREDPYYQVLLTEEGHACQHDILYRVFRHSMDEIVTRALNGQADKKEICRAASVLGGQSGTPHPDQVKDFQRKGWESNSKQVVLVHIETGTETSYESLQAAARAINGCASALCNVIKGKRKSHKGYTAQYTVG